MINLTINNSCCKLTELSREQLLQLRNVVSYESKYNPFSAFPNKRVSLVMKDGSFPTGVLPEVENWLKSNLLPFNRKFLWKRPVPQQTLFTLQMPLTPYPYQESLLVGIPERNRGTISAITGSGKSIMMAMLINKLQLRTLVIVPNLTLKQQLTDTFTKLFGSLDENVLRIEYFGASSLKNANDYDVLIIDEAHHSNCNTIRTLNKKKWEGIYYRYFFTGTPFRSLEQEQTVLKSVIGDIIHEVTYEQAVKAKTIVPVEAFYVEIPKHPNPPKTKMWAPVYSSLVTNNIERNHIITAIVDALKTAKISTLILVKEIAHGQLLSEMTGCHFAKGQNEDNAEALRIFNIGKRQMIGTIGVMGEGADTKPTEWVVIAGLGKSKPSILQQVGRGLRRFGDKKTCKVLLFYDPSHKWTREHFREQCKILLDTYGIKPLKLEV